MEYFLGAGRIEISSRLFQLSILVILSVSSCFGGHASNTYTDFCHFFEEDERWWLGCPHSGLERTLSMGVNHVEDADSNISSGKPCRNGTWGPRRNSTLLNQEICPWFYDSYDKSLNVSVFELSNIARYGNSSAWAQAAADNLRSWNFNTVGCWSSPLLTGDNLEEGALNPGQHVVERPDLMYGYMLDMLVTSYERRATYPSCGSWECPSHKIYPLVDVFSERFAARCDAIARRHASARRNDHRLLGYWFDNEVTFDPDWGGGHDLLGSTFALWTGESKARVVQWLAGRHGGNGTLPGINSTARRVDNEAFVMHYVDTYFRVATTAVRTHDPNHMILGPRILQQRNFDIILKAISPYVDVVDVHCYSTRPCPEFLQHIHNITNKPILMSEFGFRARDSGLPNTKGAGPLLWYVMQ